MNESMQRASEGGPRENALLSAVWALDHALRSLSKRMQVTHGLTGPQRLVLLLLAEHGEATPGGLADAMHIHPSTLTGVLTRLQEKALVERTTDTIDGRRAYLSLTKRGLLAVRAKSGTVEAAAGRTLARVSSDDLDTALRVLDVFAEEVRR